MTKLFLAGLIFCFSSVVQGQSLLGKWQLVKQSTCVEDELNEQDDSEDEAEAAELINDMKSMSGPTAQVIHFKDNVNAEENTRIINRRKTYNPKALQYKFTGQALHILDKRSKTIIESFTVEKLTADSLIISNSARVCETKVFIKIK